MPFLESTVGITESHPLTNQLANIIINFALQQLYIHAYILLAYSMHIVMQYVLIILLFLVFCCCHALICP